MQNIEFTTTALLTLDCQNGILEFVPGSDSILPQTGRVLSAARNKGMKVIHVGIGFRPGYPEVHPEHPTFSQIRSSGRFVTGTESAKFHSSLNVQEGEITIVKHRVSAFSGNDLKMILRAQGIRHLVLFGIATSGIVLSTVREASDMDFQLTVLADCCFDRDEEVHRVLTGKIFPRQANVMSSADFVKALK